MPPPGAAAARNTPETFSVSALLEASGGFGESSVAA
jgi:hypothetical protein